jgi:acetylornithine aminotransferase
MGALSITGQESKRLAFKPLLRKIQYVPFDDLSAAKRAISKRVAMFIVEPIQGENGVVVPKPGYLQGLRELTTKHGVLLAIDAVQTGMGRTGTWFGYENEKITPDVITLAKGLGGGLPLGAMIAIGDAAGYFKPGSHGSTFGGNPISCASSLAAISVLERDGLLKQCLEFEARLKMEIGQIDSVLEVRGAGLLLGIVLKESKAKDFTAKLQAAGVLVNAATENVIRIAPPLIVSPAQVSEFVQIFRKVATENGY